MSNLSSLICLTIGGTGLFYLYWRNKSTSNIPCLECKSDDNTKDDKDKIEPVKNKYTMFIDYKDDDYETYMIVSRYLNTLSNQFNNCTTIIDDKNILVIPYCDRFTLTSDLYGIIHFNVYMNNINISFSSKINMHNFMCMLYKNYSDNYFYRYNIPNIITKYSDLFNNNNINVNGIDVNKQDKTNIDDNIDLLSNSNNTTVDKDQITFELYKLFYNASK